LRLFFNLRISSLIHFVKVTSFEKHEHELAKAVRVIIKFAV